MKGVYLVAALVLPILVFLFLKFFGHNEFAVAPLFQQTMVDAPTDCDIVYAAPYAIPDSVMIRYGLQEKTFSVILFTDTLRSPMVAQTAAEFKKEDVEFKIVADENSFLVDKQEKYLSLLSEQQFEKEKHCVFLLKDPFDMVLVDKHGVMFGQYDSHDREEIDRLVAELLIVFKRF